MKTHRIGIIIVVAVATPFAACNTYVVLPESTNECADGEKNGSESDIDCGGDICAKCVVDSSCAEGSDCAVGQCIKNICTVSCTPGAMQSCYGGSDDTLDQGICAAGTQTCSADGAGFGPCDGEVLPEPLESCATADDDDCNGKATCDGAALWSNAWGSTNTDVGRRVVADANDNVYVASWLGGAVNFGGGPRTPSFPAAPDIVIVKYDPAGTYVWDRLLTATNGFSLYSFDLGIDGDGSLYVTGGFSGSLDFHGTCRKLDNGNDPAFTTFLAKLDASGVCTWAKSFGDGTATHYASGVRVSPAGEILLIGEFDGAITLGSTTLSSQGQNDAFVAKLDAAGSPVWAKSFGGPENDSADAAFDSQGGVVVYGNFQGSALLDGESKTSAGLRDLFLGKYSPDGVKLWLEPAGDAGDQHQARVLVEPESDNIVLTGWTVGSFNFGESITGNDPYRTIFALKMGPDKSWLWGKPFPGGTDEANNAALDPLGNLIFVGISTGGTDFGGGPLPYPAIVVKLDPQGEHVWSNSYGGAGVSSPLGLTADTHGNTIFTGTFDTAIELGRESYVAKPGADPCPAPFLGCGDAFVAKLGP